MTETNPSGTHSHIRTLDLSKALQAAAKRCEGYLTVHGVHATWTVTTIGLELRMKWGDEVKKYVSWIDVDLSYDINRKLELTEEHALQGLSS